jgi:RNA polymerase sigma factor (sigma-70 family)
VSELAVLVRAAQAGDGRAFDALAGRLRAMAYAAALARLADHHLALDAAQDAFVEAYAHLQQLQEPAAFPGWFRQILFRQCYRLARRRRHLLPLESVLDVASAEPAPEQALLAWEVRRDIHGALGALPLHQRVPAELHYLDGYSLQEISSALDVPVTTLKKRLHAARGRMRRRMGAASPVEPRAAGSVVLPAAAG